MPTPAALSQVTKQDYILPEDGWSMLLLRQGWPGVRSYLRNPHHLLPEIRARFEAVRRDHPSARIMIEESDPYLLYYGQRFPIAYRVRSSRRTPPTKAA